MFIEDISIFLCKIDFYFATSENTSFGAHSVK